MTRERDNPAHMIYAIGDIHGQLDMLKAAHALIEADRKAAGDAYATIVHLGDLTDRGPDSKGVIDYLLDGIERGEDWVVVKGNHDRLFANYIRAAALSDTRLRAGLSWLSSNMGGDMTLRSYGVGRKLLEREDRLHNRALQVVPEAHIAFLDALPLWYQEGELLFVHAGIRPGVALEDQAEDDLIWIRDPFLWDMRDHPWLVIHGHTPVDKPEHYGNRINLDTGAGYGRPLTAAVFEGTDCFVLAEDGREPLLPPGS